MTYTLPSVPNSIPNGRYSVAAVAAAALAQHNGGQVDPSILEYARQAAQRAIDANANQGGGGGFQNPAPMDDAQFPEE